MTSRRLLFFLIRKVTYVGVDHLQAHKGPLQAIIGRACCCEGMCSDASACDLQAQHIGQASPHWGGTGYKSLHGGDSRFGHANINVTADASIGYLPEGKQEHPRICVGLLGASHLQQELTV